MNRPDLAAVLAAHLPRDRYNEEGESIGTYCTCGRWTGDYFADGEAGPFDAHLAAVLNAAVDAWLEDEKTRERMWEAIAEVRDASPRTVDDADSWDVLDAALAALTQREDTP